MGKCLPTCGKREQYMQKIHATELAKYYNEQLLDLEDSQDKLLKFQVAISNIHARSLTKVFDRSGQ